MDEDRKVMPGEAARRLGVHTRTLVRWASIGKIEHIITPTGQHRYPESEVRRLESARHPQEGEQ